ncbi:O-phosphoseryl-tRNA(Sec) selenium transferase, partial [Candidatus Thorarchaeota archaeon]
ARVFSAYVERLSAGFNHGVGRSGQLNEPQPKAVGASLMQQIANTIALDALRKLGLSNTRAGLVTPLSTGMSIALVLGGLRRELDIKCVLYPRIDHKSPQRAISLTGLEELPIPTLLDGDAVCADIEALESTMAKTPSCAVLATTTFFPPREPDPIKQIAKLCSEHDIPLVINNAYGVQSRVIMDQIHSAIDAGRVDAVVQSSDKNFLAPVGSSIIVSPNPQIIDWTSDTYAGRATAAPITQTLAALLALGLNNYRTLQQQQLENIALLNEKMQEFSASIGQRVLQVNNPVACAVTMDGIDVRELGARLYNERVTGPRAVEKGSYGSSIDDYPHSYLVMNAAIGARKIDIENATTKLYKQASTLIKSP